MLKINEIKTFYGKVGALWDVSLEIMAKEIVALVGANGAGKTTLLNTISGLTIPASGTMEFLGVRIDGIPPHRIVQLGISHVPEGGNPFPDMTVRENLEMGAFLIEHWREKRETFAQVYGMFPMLEKRAGQLASTLSGGERQMLAMGRGLMMRPKLCMFDEPSYGLAPVVVRELFASIKRLHAQGMTILIVEQNVLNALETSNKAYVLENGRVVLLGKSEELLKNEHVKKAYLGL